MKREDISEDMVSKATVEIKNRIESLFKYDYPVIDILESILIAYIDWFNKETDLTNHLYMVDTELNLSKYLKILNKEDIEYLACKYINKLKFVSVKKDLTSKEDSIIYTFDIRHTNPDNYESTIMVNISVELKNIIDLYIDVTDIYKEDNKYSLVINRLLYELKDYNIEYKIKID